MRKQIDWNRIENFVGYGRLDAPVVFVGMEEGASGDLREELIQRSSWDRVVDIPGKGVALLPTWRVMCEIMLHKGGCSASREDKRNYMIHKLGKSQGETLLTELMPYPSSSMSVWPKIYVDEKGYQNRDEYLKSQLNKRFDLLRTEIIKYPREMIVCYGKAYWNYYADLFEISSKIDRGNNWLRFNSKYAKTLILSPHFVARGFKIGDL
jgi:hypothetical protein